MVPARRVAMAAFGRCLSPLIGRMKPMRTFCETRSKSVINIPVYGPSIIQTRHQTGRATATTEDELDESDGEGDHDDGEFEKLAAGKPRKGQLDYFYRIAAIDGTESTIKREEIDDVLEAIRDVTSTLERASSSGLLAPLHRLASGKTKKELIGLLPVFVSLPHRWNTDRSLDRRWLDRIGTFVIDLVVDNFAGGRLSELSKDELVVVLDAFSIFYSLSASRQSLIVELIRLLGEQCGKLSNHQLLHLLFSIGLHRRMPASVPRRLENELIIRHASFTVEQLWLAAFAFYRTDTILDGRRFLDLVVQKDVDSSAGDSDYSNYGRVMTVKLLKMNGRHDHAVALSYLARSLTARPLTTYPVCYWSHFASASRRMRYHNVEVEEKMLERLISDMEHARTKDVVLVLNYLAAMNHPLKENVTEAIASYFRSQKEDDWPNLPVRAMYALSLMDVYLEDLISRYLEPGYLKELASQRRKNMARLPARALFWLDCSVAIERPAYTGHRLDLSLFKQRGVAALLDDTTPIQYVEAADGQLCIAAHLVQLAIGCNADRIYRGLILPHSPSPSLLLKFKGALSKSDIVLSTVDSSMRRITREDAKVPAGELWVAILLQTEGSCKRKSTQFLGHHVAHQRQLEKLGYKVLVIKHKSLPARPTASGVKRFEQIFQQINQRSDLSSFVY